MQVLLVCSCSLNFVWYICFFHPWLQESMEERDQVWEHRKNLFPGFKCKYCVKEFCGGGATMLKEHLAEKVGMLRGALNVHRTYRTTSYV
jgi:hypothetical protein